MLHWYMTNPEYRNMDPETVTSVNQRNSNDDDDHTNNINEPIFTPELLSNESSSD
jgi:hypothetical protein